MPTKHLRSGVNEEHNQLQLNGWRKVIGLRNALVLDYLNIDPEIIRSVITQGYSDRLFVFAELGLEW